MKRLLALALAAILFTFCSCGTSLESTAEEKATALRIAGFDVSYEMLRYAAMNALSDYRLKHYDAVIDGNDGLEKLNRELLDDAVDALCTTYGCLALARERGIDPFDETIAAIVDSTLLEKEAGYSSDGDFKASLTKSGMTKNVLRTLLLYEALYVEIYDDMLKKGDIISDDEALRDLFAGDDFICVKVLCFSTERHTIEECEELAAKAEEELDAGADFDKYVDRNGEMLEMFKNTDGLYVCRGIWREEIEDAAFALEIGERSEPVVSPDGVRILLRCEKSDEYLAENFESLKSTYKEGVFRLAMEKAVQSASEQVELPADFYKRSVFEMKID